MTSERPLQTSYCFSVMRRGKSTTTTPTGSGTGSTKLEESQLEPQPISTSNNNSPTAAGQQQQQQDGSASHPYESSIRTIATVSTVESFWEVYNYLKRPSDLPATTDYHFFRGGIKPTWEDPSNAKGGKWIVRLPKGLASRYWEEIILAMIGGQMGPGSIPDGEVCGAVLSVRYAEDILGVWNRNAADREMVDRIRDAIKKCLQLPPQANMEYKPHQNSLADRSSFRNTQVWKPKALGERSASMGEPLGTSPPTPSAMTSGSGHIPGTSSNPAARRPNWSAQDAAKLKRGESTGGRWRNPN